MHAPFRVQQVNQRLGQPRTKLEPGHHVDKLSEILTVQSHRQINVPSDSINTVQDACNVSAHDVVNTVSGERIQKRLKGSARKL